MKTIILGVILFLGISLLGVGMFTASRWTRNKNKELKSKHADSFEQAEKDMLEGKKGSIVKYFNSSMPKSNENVGNFLATGIIVFILALASLLYYLWMTRI